MHGSYWDFVIFISCFARLELRLCFIVQLKLYLLSCTDLLSRDYADRRYLRHFSSAYQHNKIRTPLPILFHRKHILIHILGGGRNDTCIFPYIFLIPCSVRLTYRSSCHYGHESLQIAPSSSSSSLYLHSKHLYTTTNSAHLNYSRDLLRSGTPLPFADHACAGAVEVNVTEVRGILWEEWCKWYHILIKTEVMNRRA